MDPFIGEIRVFAFTFAPRDWAECDGRLIPVQQHTPLYSIVGTTYGGDGKTNFALPNLKSRAAMQFGQGPGLSDRTIGETGGSEGVTLSVNQIPAHNHAMQGSQLIADSSQPDKHVTGRPAGSLNMYADNSNVIEMSTETLANTGEGISHNNMQPYLTMKFCIALSGIYPNRQ